MIVVTASTGAWVVPVPVASAAVVGDIHPTGKWNGAMTVGKKPGSTNPKDAFAGRLRELVISR